MTRKALGRGLSALIQEVEATKPTGVDEVSIDLIDPNPFQPRRSFSEQSLKDLADSIRATGVVQPILLRRAPAERFQIVAGERRWRAAGLAGLQTVPAVIRDLSDQDTIELALTENLLREDLNPLEVAHAYQQLQERFNLTHEEIAERLGSNRSTVTNSLRLLRLSHEIQEMISRGDLSSGHARALLALESTQEQERLARLIVKQGLSVRQVEKHVATASQPKPTPVEPQPVKIDPNTRAAVLELERTLGTRVRLNGGSDRGKIEIQYYSAEDLIRIYEIIVNRQVSQDG